MFSSKNLSNQKPLLQSVVYGGIPTEDCFPVLIAKEKGYFEKNGLDVKIRIFQSGDERDEAFAKKETQVMNGDPFGCLRMQQKGIKSTIGFRTIYPSTHERHVCLLASPHHFAKNIQDLKEIKTIQMGTALKSMGDYAIEQLLKMQGITTKIEKISIPQMYLRLEKLLSGEVPFMMLPEPLATLAENRGAKVIVDDQGTDFFQTMAVFQFVENNLNKKLLESFQESLKMADQQIRKADRLTMMQKFEQFIQLPVYLKNNYRMPEFYPESSVQPNYWESAKEWFSQQEKVFA